MKKNLIIILLLIIASAINLSARYVCTQNEAFLSWLNQNPVDVNDDTVLIKYSNLASCQSQCRNINSCIRENNSTGYTCPIFGQEIPIGGDMRGNLFTAKSQCDSACYMQYSCTEWTENPKCRPTSFEKTRPVSDVTGKTVFTQYNIAWDCNTSTVAAGNCLEYTTQRIEDNTTFNTSRVGWETKNFVGADEAMASVAGMEQLQHLWSGWNGMCENGIKMDNSWISDPATLLSMASMMYNGALTQASDGTYAYGETMHNAVSQVNQTFTDIGNQISTAATNASNAVSNAASSVGSTVGDWSSQVSDAFGFSSSGAGQTISQTASGATSGITNATDAANAMSTSSWAQIRNTLNTEIIDATDYTTAVTYGNAARNAASIIMAGFAEPAADDFELADDFMHTMLGQEANSIAAINYAQCMAAIGLSFPNTFGHAVDDNQSMSAQLREPWRNPINLSNNQLAYLMRATSENFVRASYIQINYDGNIGRYVAITSLAYQQAGQVICGGGKAAIAININNQAAAQQDSGGLNGAAMANAAIQSAMSYLPPPYNLMASIAFRIATSISNGDACHDEDIAMKWGIQQYKTYKALSHDQCHYTESECAASWAWGSCMRRRHYYCCYDQEITRIFVEGIKLQLGREWERNECDDIALSDLKEISFRKCLEGEEPAEDKCFPAVKWEELNSALGEQMTKDFDAQDLVDAAIDSMPIADDPWGPRIGD